jgi:hypothetical protein
VQGARGARVQGARALLAPVHPCTLHPLHRAPIAPCTMCTLHRVHLARCTYHALIHCPSYVSVLRYFAFLRSSSLHTEAGGSSTPDAFGPFRVLQQIGAGALGPVLRAYEPDRDRHVAVKLFRLDLPPERVHQLVAEFERLIAQGLNRPGIAAPLAAGIDGNSAYLVQEFIAADSLDVLVRDYGPAPPPDALQVAVQLAGALDFAAVVNVTHGALHPRDVLLTTDEARITGLGVARALERVGVAAPIRRPYSAPERIAGAKWDRRADVFGLAAIVHEMLWGRRVQGTGSQAAGALTDLPGADLRSLQTTFARALADRQEDRFNTALEFAAALKQAFPQVVASQLATPTDSRLPTTDSRLPQAVPLPLEPTTTGAVADMEIRAAEPNRFRDVEAAPGVVSPAPALAAAPVRVPAGVLGLQSPHAGESALERSRSALWPLALALAVGLALGFAAGFAVGNRDRAVAQAGTAPPTTPSTTTQPAAAQSTPPSSGREFTDAPVNEPAPAERSAASRPTGTSASVDAGGPRAPREPVSEGSSAAAAATTPPVGTATDVGRLFVRSTPAGARVFVDGRERGRTPAAIRDLARGPHRVRLVQEGYATEERRVVVSGSRRSQSISVALARARASAEAPARPAEGFYGSLSVDSLPSGAKVFMDGKLLGTTPMLLPQVGAGEHVVRLQHEAGYRTWSSSVRVVAGERNRVTASLER